MNTQTKGGPKTDAGKAITRYNAIKHGLLTKEVFIEGEDKKQLAEIKDTVYETLNPVGPIEHILVDRIISNVWRLRRALHTETSAMEWYLNDVDLFPISQNEKQQKRKSTKNMLSNESVDNILRYETTIERSLFRALHELERLQAKRNGQSVTTPAVVDVNVDSSFRKNDF